MDDYFYSYLSSFSFSSRYASAFIWRSANSTFLSSCSFLSISNSATAGAKMSGPTLNSSCWSERRSESASNGTWNKKDVKIDNRNGKNSDTKLIHDL